MTKKPRGRLSALVTPLLLLTAQIAGAEPPMARTVDVSALADKIDRRLARVWQAAGVEPAPVTDDAAFLRRVTLDLTGRIPTVGEARAFVADKRADKRRQFVDKLVDSAAYSGHFATVWRRSWLPQTDVEPHEYLADEVDAWIASQLRRHVPYDRMIRELLTAAPGGLGRLNAPTRLGKGTDERSTQAFIRANEHKPESLASNATQAFLGINLQCAQCHDHPFARWSRDQFWQTAAFFARPTRGTDGAPSRLELRIADTPRLVTPVLLTSEKLAWPPRIEEDTGRELFAGWLTARENPYFAKNAVNRLWAHFFGVGLIEPLDDLTGKSEPVDDELFGDLAQAFVASGYDLLALSQAIVLSKAYQRESLAPRSSASTEGNDASRRSARELFGRANVRGLSGEQLYDSLRIAAGLPLLRQDLDSTELLRERRQFTARFRISRASAAERSILQSLTLMNGDLTVRLTSAADSPTVRAVAEAPFLGPRERVVTLYLAALGRQPAPDELEALVPRIAPDRAQPDARRALADVLWALFNSAEFNTNH